LSRACLGKTNIFSIKWRKTRVSLDIVTIVGLVIQECSAELRTLAAERAALRSRVQHNVQCVLALGTAVTAVVRVDANVLK
jgi:hypothetical protein